MFSIYIGLYAFLISTLPSRRFHWLSRPAASLAAPWLFGVAITQRRGQRATKAAMVTVACDCGRSTCTHFWQQLQKIIRQQQHSQQQQ